MPSLEGFVAFNARYLAQLKAWDLVEDAPPTLTRTNVVPLGTTLSEEPLLCNEQRVAFVIPRSRTSIEL